MIPVNTNIHGRVIGIKDVPDGFTITLQAFLRHVSELILTKNEASGNSWQQKAQKERNDLHGVVHWASNAAAALAGADAVFGVNFSERQQRCTVQGKWLSFSTASLLVPITIQKALPNA